MRSVAVVFPASMCAMIPMFRQRFRGVVRATAILPCGPQRPLFIRFRSPPCLDFITPDPLAWPASTLRFRSARLPAVVREGLVGLSHAVYVFLLLHRCAATVSRIQQL